ncbi:hypothetical protein B9Z19DRAFT_1157567 [Tuber borchii]|uniref:AMP-dependent synthetase/ligase domain-containing protein n=1 Tax=Tuber borchii TaxID=42251 RepID=A0A2T6ZGJ6_TUBBO|nr:hypothetical protein B9Z19DRAFT_1157567 [Tuber borchii]
MHRSRRLSELKPTVLVGVPAVWENVKKGIMDQVLFWGALALKSFLLQICIPGTAVLDAVVFKKIKAATGGRLKISMSGGGPVAKETQHFISMALCPMVIGYGLTETSAMGALMDPAEWNINNPGTALTSVEIKLVDFPDAGYFTTNEPEQGEILIRGNVVATHHGCFKTRDISEWNKNGHLRIINRKQNLVKTSNREYIAPKKISFHACPPVADICVYADQNKTKPVALIIPFEGPLRKLAAEAGVESGPEELLHDDKAAVPRELIGAGRQGCLASIKLVEGVVLTEEEWTPQNNLVTSAQKPNFRGILEK